MTLELGLREQIGKRQAYLWAVAGAATFMVLGLASSSQIIHIEGARSQYTHAIPRDSISRLQDDINSGRVKLTFDAQFGYLPSVLKALHLSAASQVVVFSKTSVQKDLISPENPRSLYFNDSTYVGYVSGAKALEICTSEPYLGGVYYTLLQREVEKPRFFRTIEACLECHADKAFTHLPRHIMYSTRCAQDGSPITGHTPLQVSDSTPFYQRYGGWFVTGGSSGQMHRGNQAAISPEYHKAPDAAQVSEKSITKVIFTGGALTEYSDITALMVFGHQQALQNLIANATYQTNSALALDKLSTSADHLSNTDHLTEVLKRDCEPVVAGLLFADEARLNGRISGDSGFAGHFSNLGPKDRHGRSLRAFDLQHRLFRYPCSYLIYSESFSALPPEAKTYIYRRLWEVLLGTDKSGRFSSLTAADRKAIREILTDTKPEFAASRQL